MKIKNKQWKISFDGAELGSTSVRENVELPVGETVNQQTLQMQTKTLHLKYFLMRLH